MFQLLELIENEEDREFCRKLSEQFDSAMYHVAYGILKNSADAERCCAGKLYCNYK